MKERVDILLVDDRPDKLLALQAALSSLDEHLVLARSGREALQKVLRQDFAVILMDVGMPEMDGFETAALIRQRPRCATTPIIFVSAQDRAETISRGYSLGAVDFVTAPFEAEILLAKVSVFVELHRKTAQVRRQADERAARIRAEAAQQEAEAARERSALLADAGALLAGSLDTSETLPALARVLATRLADYCAIGLRDADGALRSVGVAHRDPARGRLAAARADRFPFACLRAPDDTEAAVGGSAEALFSDAAQGTAEELAIDACLIAPIRTRAGTQGLLHLARPLGRDFTPAEADLAAELALRVGLSLDNAALYRAAEEARRRAEEADRAKDRFLAMLSHELRTPLTPVLHAVDLLEGEAPLSGEMREALASIRRSVQLEARLIDDLLDLTRIARGKLLLEFGATEAHRLLDQVLALLEHDFAEKRLVVERRFEATRTRLWADTARVHQIFWNLLRNAVKFTPPGGRVTVCTADDEHGRLRMEVHDSGVGIEPEALDRIFDAFTQTDAGRQVGGLGLGLTITRSLVELHGGHIVAVSAGRDHGATFRVVLPTADVARVEPSAVAGPAAPTAAPRRRRLRLLVVDDHPETLLFFGKMLSRHGYEVRTAETVAGALRAAEEAPFDLLISDVGLPDGTGMDLIRRLAADGPVLGIAISGYGSEEDVARSKAAGFAEHVTKPFDFKQLDELIQRIAPPERDAADRRDRRGRR